MRIRANTAALILPLLFFIVIGSTMLSGLWITESSKIPARFEEGDFSGEYDPADIRGSYSLGDIEAAFFVPVETLAKVFGLAEDSDPSGTQVKELEARFGIIDGLEVGTDSVRWFVSLYIGLPFTPGEETALPQPAWNLLRSEGIVDEAHLEKIKPKVVSLADAHEVSTDASEGDSGDEIERLIKGKTLFSDVLDWGVSQEEIESVLGMSMGQRSLIIRDFCEEQGMEFSPVKEELQDLVDSRN